MTYRPGDCSVYFSSAWRPAAKRIMPIASSLLAALSLAGCVVAPLPPQGAMVVEPGAGPVVVAAAAPPPPMAETVVVSPGPGYFWIGGYWSWVGGRHVWTAGHWTPHRQGYHWVPRHWVQGPGGWHQHGGHWGR